MKAIKIEIRKDTQLTIHTISNNVNLLVFSHQSEMTGILAAMKFWNGIRWNGNIMSEDQILLK